MTFADPTSEMPNANGGATAVPQVRVRDPRLDFFRGIAMFIILIAHVPSNWLTLWIPARFGFSDATETFVFCSGMASAIAFGTVFRKQGFAMGTARIAFRTWQVYWAHISLFIAIAATMVVMMRIFPDGRDYIDQLNLYPFFNRPQENLVGLLTLTYVPNYFDILPMYLVILAMIPLMFALANVHVGLAIFGSVLIWLSANVLGWNFPAEPWSDRQWFFNPLGWQLIFFTGFALMSGWISPPPVDRRLFWGAVALVVVFLPFAYFRVYQNASFFLNVRNDWTFLIQKTDFGALRYVHFLATAYIAWVLVGPKGARIMPRNGNGILSVTWSYILAAIMKVGQQSLAVFITSMFLARLLGVLLDQVGRSYLTMAWVNALGIALVIALAYGVGWFKSQPWKKKV